MTKYLSCRLSATRPRGRTSVRGSDQRLNPHFFFAFCGGATARCDCRSSRLKPCPRAWDDEEKNNNNNKSVEKKSVHFQITFFDSSLPVLGILEAKEDEAAKVEPASTLLCHQSIEDWEENWLFRRKRPPGILFYWHHLQYNRSSINEITLIF